MNLQYRVVSPEYIAGGSRVKVTVEDTPSTFGKAGSLSDPRLGPRMSGERCEWCSLPATTCCCDLWGHIALPFPVKWGAHLPGHQTDCVLVVKSILRPYSRGEDGVLASHPLTKLYSTIIRVARRQAGTGAVEQAKLRKDLEAAVYALARDGVLSGLGSKEGDFRKTMLGKRIDFTARSVITSNPHLTMEEVGVPDRLADRLGLEDGGVVVFGRQPTLHKGSMLAFTARRVPGLTLQLSADITQPFNADFDGDCMYIVAPQGIEARADAMEIMHSSKNILDENGRAQFGLVQNALLGVHLLSKSLVSDPGKYWWHHREPTPCILKPKPLWSGIQLLSDCLPPTLCFESKAVTIRHGEWLCGEATDHVLGAGSPLLTHIATHYPREFSSTLWKLRQHATTGLHVSVGLGDCPQLEPVVGMTLDERVERMSSHLATHPENRMGQMIQSGAKGKAKNLVYAQEEVGSQQVAGEDLPRFIEGKRMFPSDASEESVSSSISTGYLGGLSIKDTFKGACKARYDVSARALLTANTGYLSRRLNQFLLPFRLAADGVTVIDDYQRVVAVRRVVGNAGERLGLVAASAIAAPLTQDVLDTFHCSTSEKRVDVKDILAMKDLDVEDILVTGEEGDTRDVVYCQTEFEQLVIFDYCERFQAAFGEYVGLPVGPVTRLVIDKAFPHHSFRDQVTRILQAGIDRFVLSDDGADAYYELQVEMGSDWPKLFSVSAVPDFIVGGRRTGPTEMVMRVKLGGGAIGPAAVAAAVGGRMATAIENPVTVFKWHGIEALREFLYRQFREAFGGGVLDEHLALLADAMTYRGEPAAVSFSGVKRQQNSIIGLAGFERPAQVLAKAAMDDAIDNADSVELRVITGQLVCDNKVQVFEEGGYSGPVW